MWVPMFEMCRLQDHPLTWITFLLLLDSGFRLSGDLSGRNHKHVTVMSRLNVMHPRQTRIWFWIKTAQTLSALLQQEFPLLLGVCVNYRFFFPHGNFTVDCLEGIRESATCMFSDFILFFFFPLTKLFCFISHGVLMMPTLRNTARLWGGQGDCGGEDEFLELPTSPQTLEWLQLLLHVGLTYSSSQKHQFLRLYSVSVRVVF